MIDISLGHYLFLASIIFTIGVIGIFLNRKNVIVLLMSVELILIAVNINLVAFSVYLQDIAGQVFTMFVLTVAAGEAAIGLAILVVFFRNHFQIWHFLFKHLANLVVFSKPCSNLAFFFDAFNEFGPKRPPLHVKNTGAAAYKKTHSTACQKKTHIRIY